MIEISLQEFHRTNHSSLYDKIPSMPPSLCPLHHLSLVWSIGYLYFDAVTLSFVFVHGNNEIVLFSRRVWPSMSDDLIETELEKDTVYLELASHSFIGRFRCSTILIWRISSSKWQSFLSFFFAKTIETQISFNSVLLISKSLMPDDWS